MSSFTAAGRAWNLEVSIPTRKAVREYTGGKVDIFAAFDDELYKQLADPETLVDVLWAMVKDQAGDPAAGGVSPAEFGRAFRGDLIEQAATALNEAINDFFPSRQKAILTKATLRGNEAMAAIFDKIDKSLDAPALATTSNENSANSQASAVPPPAG